MSIITFIMDSKILSWKDMPEIGHFFSKEDTPPEDMELFPYSLEELKVISDRYFSSTGVSVFLLQNKAGENFVVDFCNRKAPGAVDGIEYLGKNPDEELLRFKIDSWAGIY